MRADEIDYRLIGDDLQGVIITLDPGEAVVAEAGAMMYMQDGISMATTLDGTIGMSYLMWREPTWRMRSGALAAEYGVVYFVLMWEVARAIVRVRAAGAAVVTSDSPPSLFPPPLRGSSA